jgi:phospholipid/cholesterol/gamma-HCH transport system substrate-binding protein
MYAYNSIWLNLPIVKVSNETKVGALTAIAITILVLGYNFLKGKDLFTSTTKYYAIYNRVDGLAPSNAITINGYRIGQVIGVNLIPEDSMRVKVTLEIKSEIKVGDSAVAKIFDADLFGSKAIELVLNSSKSKRILNNGDTLISEVQASIVSSVSKIVAPIKDKAENLIESLDSVFGGETGANLKGTIANLNAITTNFKNTSKRLDGIVSSQEKRLDVIFANVLSISTNLKNNNEAITATIQNLKSFSDTLAAVKIQQLVANAENALAQVNFITEKINKGEGSLGLLINDKELYNNLNKSSADLDALLKDMKENPKKYVHFSIW